MPSSSMTATHQISTSTTCAASLAQSCPAATGPPSPSTCCPCGNSHASWTKRSRKSRKPSMTTTTTDTQPAPPETSGMGQLQSLRSEEHTSELQSRLHLVCRLLLEKKKIHIT